jgi:hypothetical protein
MKVIYARSAVLSLIILGACLSASELSFAQSAEGISVITYDATDGQIDSYSITEVDYVASLDYIPYVEGYLYQSADWNNPIDSATAFGSDCVDSYDDPSLVSCAWANMTAVPAVSGSYELKSDHYVLTIWSTGYDETYYDYYGFSPYVYTDDIGGGENFAPGGGYDTGGGYATGGGESYAPVGSVTVINTNLIYLGSTAVGVPTFDPTPVIASVTPAIIPDSPAQQVIVTGQHFGAAPKLQFPDAPDMSISYTSVSDTQIIAQITPNGDEGAHRVQVISTGASGTGFLSSPRSSSTSPADTLTVSGNACTWQISTDQQLYHIASSIQGSSSNYQSASIPITAMTNQNAVCPGASQVTWTVMAMYASSEGKGTTQSNLPGFSSSLNQTVNYTTPPGSGGQLWFTATFTTGSGTTPQGMSKRVYLDGTAIPTSQVKSLLVQDYSPPSGGTPNLFVGVACKESNFKQFSTTTLEADGATSIPLVLYGMNANWPNESFGGGAHIGITMVKTNMADAYDWQQNVADGTGPDYFGWALGQAKAYVKSEQQTYPNLPNPSGSQLEDMALTYYRWGAKFQGNTYWVRNFPGTAWVKNTDANYTDYTDSVRGNLDNPSCQ